MRIRKSTPKCWLREGCKNWHIDDQSLLHSKEHLLAVSVPGAFISGNGRGFLDFMQSGNSAFAVVDLHGEYILRLRRLNPTKPHTNYQHLTPSFQLPAVERLNSLQNKLQQWSSLCRSFPAPSVCSCRDYFS